MGADCQGTGHATKIGRRAHGAKLAGFTSGDGEPGHRCVKPRSKGLCRIALTHSKD